MNKFIKISSAVILASSLLTSCGSVEAKQKEKKSYAGNVLSITASYYKNVGNRPTVTFINHKEHLVSLNAEKIKTKNISNYLINKGLVCVRYTYDKYDEMYDVKVIDKCNNMEEYYGSR